MGLYATYIFPRLMDWVMSGEEFHRLRTSLLKDVEGTVLEIGFGTGLNLAHYPHGILHLDVVDPAGFLPQRIAARIAAVPFAVQSHRNMAEALPFDDAQFDSVVSTWTLCSLADPQKALGEIRRVLKPNGRFLFLEHGRSRDQRIAAWQDRLNPIQNIIGCGCHLNRRIDKLITSSGLRIEALDRFQMETVPRLGGAMYRGWATPSA
ncbi:MAG TPA: class I SAM-dependent methyltransferase [Nitrospira sp.]